MQLHVGIVDINESLFDTVIRQISRCAKRRLAEDLLPVGVRKFDDVRVKRHVCTIPSWSCHENRPAIAKLSSLPKALVIVSRVAGSRFFKLHISVPPSFNTHVASQSCAKDRVVSDEIFPIRTIATGAGEINRLS